MSAAMTERVYSLDALPPGANMYGCLPCPKCQSPYRFPTTEMHPELPSYIICDDCGYVVRIALAPTGEPGTPAGGDTDA